MKRLIPLFKALGTQFNSEHTETIMKVERAPFEGDLRKIISSTEQAIRVTTRIESWEFLWWSGYEEKSWVNYHVVHNLKLGYKNGRHVLAYSDRTEGTIVNYHKLTKLYNDSLTLVFQQVG
jgi:hypothetical protein